LLNIENIGFSSLAGISALTGHTLAALLPSVSPTAHIAAAP
jgi:hypothetical protein